MSAHESFGHWLKRQRAAQSLTQADLARLVGCAVVTLRKIEAGTLRPSQQIAAWLVDALGVPTHDQATLIALARRESPTRHSNLPTTLTALLGRAAQVAAVCDLLRGPARLLTLTGPGGIGKTRLAIQVATMLLDEFADGVFFVDLAPLSDSTLVPTAIAEVLHVREQPRQLLIDLLAQELSNKQVLLVLDNLEQLLPSAAQIIALLMAVPSLKVLITSRAVLHLTGEYVFVVPPLGLPSVENLRAAERNPAELLEQSPAVALFTARAQAASAGFALTAANAASVAAICIRLDGLSLAIELAAARSRLFTPAALLARLEHRLSLLTHGAQDLPARQQTLRATIDWSYALLGAAERALFRRLAIFSGGCTLEAVEHVCMDVNTAPTVPTGAPAQGTILPELETLFDHNIIAQQAGADDEPRFGMLETLREYAWEQLVASGELPLLQARHAAYYLAFAEAAEPQLEGANQTSWLRRLEAEHDNMRAALIWSLSPDGDFALALALAGALGLFWRLHSFFSQGQAWLAAALEAADLAATPARAKALHCAGLLARNMNDYPQAAELIEQSLAIYRMLEDSRGIADALYWLGTLAVDQSDYDQARIHYNESLPLAQALGETSLTAWVLQHLGYVARWDMDYAEAGRFFAESLALFRQLGATRGIANALWTLARNAREQCDYARATTLAEESLALLNQLGDKNTGAMALFLLGEIAQCAGDDARALARLDQAIDLVREAHGARLVGWVLTVKGLIWELRGDPTARTCYEESRRLFEQVGDPEGMAAVVFGLSRVAVREGDTVAAHRLLETFVTLRHDLKRPREAALAVCLRDAAFAAIDAAQSIALLERDLAQFHTVGDRWGVGFALRALGPILIGTGDHVRALEYVRAGLALAGALNDRLSIVIQLMALATIALRTGAIMQAAHLCGVIETSQASLGIGYVAASMWSPDYAQYAGTYQDLQARLGDAAVAAAWAAGRAQPVTEVFAAEGVPFALGT